MKTVVLETGRLILRPWDENDAEELYKYAKDPRIGPDAGWPPHKSVDDSREIIRNILKGPERYVIVLKDTGMLIGSIALYFNTDISKYNDEAELGFWLGVPYWGQGIVPEASREILRHAFEDLRLSRVWCGYYEGNEKSKRVQEKLGFVFDRIIEDFPVAQLNETKTAHVNIMTKQLWLSNNSPRRAVLYVHGKGGSAEEAEHFKPLFKGFEVFGLDYKTFSPWETGKEIKEAAEGLRTCFGKVYLVANSIGAFFSMNAGIGSIIEKAFFISPIVDMEKLISDMLLWSNSTEEELKQNAVIHTDFGEDLSWEYLSYVREHPVKWDVPTEILYGEKDDLTSFETIKSFSQTHNVRLSVMKGGEHWFHTKKQMKFLDRWLKKTQKEKKWK